MEQLYFIECGLKRKATKSLCKTCGKDFLHRKEQIRHFCSVSCKSKNQQKRVKVKCSQCGNLVEKVLTKLKCSKHGFHFCNRKCKELAQSLAGNCKEIQPSHYGTAEVGEYRKSMTQELNLGCKCGEKRLYALIVHHIDGDRTNNDKSNLEVVCGTCHMLRHLKYVEDMWVYLPSALTPRDKLFGGSI